MAIQSVDLGFCLAFGGCHRGFFFLPNDDGTTSQFAARPLAVAVICASLPLRRASFSFPEQASKRRHQNHLRREYRRVNVTGRGGKIMYANRRSLFDLGGGERPSRTCAWWSGLFRIRRSEAIYRLAQGCARAQSTTEECACSAATAASAGDRLVQDKSGRWHWRAQAPTSFVRRGCNAHCAEKNRKRFSGNCGRPPTFLDHAPAGFFSWRPGTATFLI